MEITLPYQSAARMRPRWGSSAVFHAILFGAMVGSVVFSRQGATWGGAGGQGTINVNLVGSVPAIPLPKPDVATNSRVVDTSKGLYQTETPPKAPPAPQPKVTAPDESNAMYLPKFDKYKQPEYVGKPSKVLPNPVKPPPNAIPYGQGGAPQVPTSTFMLNQSTKGGMGISGSSGGSFGSQFPWYVEAVQRRVSSNWLESTVDPSISFAPRCVVTFTILRDGTATNIQVTQSSGNQSVDMSAVRAVQSSSPLDRLPGGYGGSSVNVEFWFDFHRQ